MSGQLPAVAQVRVEKGLFRLESDSYKMVKALCTRLLDMFACRGGQLWAYGILVFCLPGLINRALIQGFRDWVTWGLGGPNPEPKSSVESGNRELSKDTMLLLRLLSATKSMSASILHALT